MDFQLEVIAFTIDSCIAARQAAVHRIELCDNPGEGGTTPSFGFIKTARKKVDLELYPIIRPRGGDFLYTDAEYEIMKADIKACKELGCDGVVIGLLNTDGTVDKVRCSELVDTAYPLGVTFHRAFDRVNDASAALEDLVAIGCERVLTSGMLPNAPDGAENIAALVRQAEGRIIVMPGSGVRSENILQLAKITGACEFHTSARMFNESKMQFNSPGMKEKLQSVALDVTEVKKIMDILKQV